MKIDVEPHHHRTSHGYNHDHDPRKKESFNTEGQFNLPHWVYVSTTDMFMQVLCYMQRSIAVVSLKSIISMRRNL